LLQSFALPSFKPLFQLLFINICLKFIHSRLGALPYDISLEHPKERIVGIFVYFYPPTLMCSNRFKPIRIRLRSGGLILSEIESFACSWKYGGGLG
jgi:hypothetical protein